MHQSREVLETLQPVDEQASFLGIHRVSTPGSTVRVALHSDDHGSELAVHDAGPAIPEALRRRIFEPLERSELASTNHSIGPELYIAREIAEAHGGAITVESTDGEGERRSAFDCRTAER